MDILLVIIEIFLLGVTAKDLRANIDFKSPFLKGVGDLPKISGRRRRPPPIILRVGKLDGSPFHMV